MSNVIYFSFCFLVEAIIFWQYSSSIFVPKRPVNKQIFVLSILYFILFLASLLESALLNTLLYFSVNFIFLITQYKINWQLTLFHSTILTAIMALCELLVYSVISRFTPHFFENKDLYNFLTFPVINKLVFFTVIYILTHILKPKEKYNQKHDQSLFLLIMIPTVSIFVMFTLISIGESASIASYLSWMVTLSAIFLLASNLLIFGINQYTQKKNREFTEMQLLLQKESDAAEYYKMLVTQHENQSILIHDIKKHLQSIDMLNQQRDHEKISAYIHQLMRSSDLKEMGRLCDHDLLNAVLSRYKRQCDNDYIDFQVDVRSKTTTFMDDTDLTSLFCNLLDNSVEAAHGIQDAFIELSVRKLENSPYIVLTVINSCRVNPFAEKNGVLATTKTDKLHHGFGLKSIRKIVSKYHGEFQQYFDDRTATFHTIITLKYT